MACGGAGGSGVGRVAVRGIALTTFALCAAVGHQKFRQDLFYRLNVIALRVPPLRERLDDLPILAAHFLKKHGGPTPHTLRDAKKQTGTLSICGKCRNYRGQWQRHG